MNLSRCENGHFYDKEKYPTCPHCAGGSASDDSPTSVFTEGDVTEPVSTMAPENPFPTAPAPAPEPFVTAPSAPVFGVASGFGADEPTMELDGAQDTQTVKLENISPSVTESVDDEDNDHTIGFFDDDFFSSGHTEAATSQPVVNNTAPAAAPVARLSTPCVGWLVALGGKHIGTDYRLKVGKNFIGRSAQMDIALTEDMSVSRDKQAVVVYEPKEHLYLVQPGEASTLVYKNEQVVLSPVQLQAYDVITVGDVNLLFIPLCNKEFNWNAVLEEMKKKEQK